MVFMVAAVAAISLSRKLGDLNPWNSSEPSMMRPPFPNRPRLLGDWEWGSNHLGSPQIKKQSLIRRVVKHGMQPTWNSKKMAMSQVTCVFQICWLVSKMLIHLHAGDELQAEQPLNLYIYVYKNGHCTQNIQYPTSPSKGCSPHLRMNQARSGPG
jgi:hypothetical protein